MATEQVGRRAIQPIGYVFTHGVVGRTRAFVSFKRFFFFQETRRMRVPKTCHPGPPQTGTKFGWARTAISEHP